MASIQVAHTYWFDRASGPNGDAKQDRRCCRRGLRARAFPVDRLLDYSIRPDCGAESVVALPAPADEENGYDDESAPPRGDRRRELRRAVRGGGYGQGRDRGHSAGAGPADRPWRAETRSPPERSAAHPSIPRLADRGESAARFGAKRPRRPRSARRHRKDRLVGLA